MKKLLGGKGQPGGDDTAWFAVLGVYRNDEACNDYYRKGERLWRNWRKKLQTHFGNWRNKQVRLRMWTKSPSAFSPFRGLFLDARNDGYHFKSGLK